MKYIKNLARPYFMTINTQRCLDWYESDGTRKVLEIIWPNREFFNWDELTSSNPPDEVVKAKRLGLNNGQKGYIYYDSTSRVTPGKPLQIDTGRIVSTKIVDEDESFDVTIYPHIVDYKIEGKGMASGRTYNIPVAGSDWAKETSEIVAVQDADLRQLIRVFHFLDECDEQGKVINKNSNRLKENNNPVEGKLPETKDVSIDEAPRRDSIERRSTLKRDDNANI